MAGDIEDKLLALFKSSNPSAKVQRVLEGTSAWPMFYHLTPQRGNLLNWYNFKNGASLLEVGAEYGALTGTFLKAGLEVTALEPSPKRRKIIKSRYRGARKLAIVDSLDKLKRSVKFDYVFCFGVNELILKKTPPYLERLGILNKFLKPKGSIILAVDNRFGLKYLSGNPDYYTGRYFDAIEDYPYGGKGNAFARPELEAALRKIGLNYQQWFYPTPDHRLPVEIFSDKLMPKAGRLVSITSPVLDRNREHLFSETLAMELILQNALFPVFANSFLVIARRSK